MEDLNAVAPLTKRKKYRKKWQRWIIKKGLRKVADRCGVSYEAVRLWVHGKTVPNDKNKKVLVKYSRGELSIGDFFS